MIGVEQQVQAVGATLYEYIGMGQEAGMHSLAQQNRHRKVGLVKHGNIIKAVAEAHNAALKALSSLPRPAPARGQVWTFTGR